MLSDTHKQTEKGRAGRGEACVRIGVGWACNLYHVSCGMAAWPGCHASPIPLLTAKELWPPEPTILWPETELGPDRMRQLGDTRMLAPDYCDVILHPLPTACPSVA